MKNLNKIVLLIIVMMFMISGCKYKEHKTEPPKAIKGVIDLSQWDFDKDGEVEIDGEWEYYEGRYIQVDEFTEEIKLIKEYATMKVAQVDEFESTHS